MNRVKFTVIVFFSSGHPAKYHNVTDVVRLLLWIENNLEGGRGWTAANAYYKDGTFDMQYRPNMVYRGHPKGFNY